jgi:hypothetical protein
VVKIPTSIKMFIVSTLMLFRHLCQLKAVFSFLLKCPICALILDSVIISLKQILILVEIWIMFISLQSEAFYYDLLCWV